MPRIFRRKKPRRGPKGQALVEFILILPVILIISSLVIDLANMVFVAHRSSAAVREGARVATETALPVPENPDSVTCSLSACADSASICCIAVNRVNLVLFNSGISGADVNGRWFTHKAFGTDYIMFEVTSTSIVNIFFGNFFLGTGEWPITATAVAYGDEA